ncbi:MAG: hypothetical protein ABI988_02035 [Nitrospirota bacterium]
MTLHFPHKAQQEEHRWLWPLIPSILAAGSFISTVHSASLAAAAECQFTAESGAIQGTTAWKGTTSSILPRTITVERDVYEQLAPSPMGEVAPSINKSRIDRGNMQNQDIAAVGDCLSQDIRKSARFNRAMSSSIGKIRAKAHTPIKKSSALSYDGKRQVRTIRTTPPEIRISSPYKAPSMIGPVQEIQKPALPDERSVSLSVAASPFQNALQLPGNESLRMNLTTMQMLHQGDCASGCP